MDNIEFTYKNFCNSFYIKCLFRCFKEHNIYNKEKLDIVLKATFNEINDNDTSLPHILISCYHSRFSDFNYYEIDEYYCNMVKDKLIKDLIFIGKTKYNINLDKHEIEKNIKEKYLNSYLMNKLNLNYRKLSFLSIILYNNEIS